MNYFAVEGLVDGNWEKVSLLVTEKPIQRVIDDARGAMQKFDDYRVQRVDERLGKLILARRPGPNGNWAGCFVDKGRP